MPTVINGCGTWYYGRSNVHSHLAPCESCGKYARLESYDTGNYFCLIYIPLLPLGKYRIIDSCPVCTKHRYMKLSQWNALKQQQITEHVNDALQNPGDRDKALAALGSAIFFEDDNAFLGLTEAFGHHYDEDAQLQAGLAEGYAFFGFPDAAVEAYERSLALADDPAARGRLIILLSHLKQPEEAEAYARPFLETRNAEFSGLLYIVAATYLETGRAQDAARLIQESFATFPELDRDKDWKKLRSKAAKGKRVRGVLPEIEAKARSRRGSGRFAAMVGPLVLLLILGIYFGVAAYQGNHRTIHIVNGLDRAYEVAIADQTVRLPRNGHRAVVVGEGDITVHVLDANLDIPEERVNISTSFWTRPFNDTTFVINPDRVAIFRRLPVTYSVTGLEEPDEEASAFAGELLYAVEDVDYPFTAPPQEIELSNGRKVTRHQLALLERDAPIETRIAVVDYQIGRATAVTLLKRRVDYEPTHETLVYLLRSYAQPAELQAFLRPHLDTRPVLIDIHRIYQSAMEIEDDRDALIADYRARLAAEPDNTALMYLLGRVLEGDESLAMFEQSVQGDPPSPYGHHALSYHHLVSGDFDAALASAERACELSDKTLFRDQRRTALHAAGRIQTLLTETNERNAQDHEPAHFGNRLYLLARLGNFGEYQRELDLDCAELRRLDYDDASIRLWKQWHEAMLAYFQLRLDQFKSLATELDDPELLFTAALMDRRWEDAAELAADDPNALALIGALASLHGDQAVGERLRSEAIELYRQGDREQRQLAAWLAGDVAPDENAIRHFEMLPNTKRIALLALGAKFPDQRAIYWPLLAKLNYDRRPPYLSITEGMVIE